MILVPHLPFYREIFAIPGFLRDPLLCFGFQEFDLGATLEATGDVSRALAVFMGLQADAGEYKDVAERVDRLSRVQTGG